MDRQLLKRLIRLLEGLLALAVVGYLGWLIYRRWIEVRDVKLSFELAPFLIGCLILFLFNFLYSFSWQTTLRLLDRQRALPPSLDLHRIFFLSFITRYLPAGSVVNIGGRVELFKRLGGSRSKGLQSIYYEQLSLITGVVVLGLVGLHFYAVEGLPAWLGSHRDLAVGALTTMALAAFLGADLIIVHGPAWARLDRLKAIWKPLSLGKKVLLWFQFAVVNLSQGFAVYWMLRAVYPRLGNQPDLTYLVVSAYLVGRLVGQMAAPVPGGLGVREGAFTFLLSAYIPVQATVVSASVFRLTSMLMEAAIAGSLVVCSRLRGRGGTEVSALDPGLPGSDPSDDMSTVD